jgi:hypothetical protein
MFFIYCYFNSYNLTFSDNSFYISAIRSYSCLFCSRSTSANRAYSSLYFYSSYLFISYFLSSSNRRYCSSNFILSISAIRSYSCLYLSRSSSYFLYIYSKRSNSYLYLCSSSIFNSYYSIYCLFALGSFI